MASRFGFYTTGSLVVTADLCLSSKANCFFPLCIASIHMQNHAAKVESCSVLPECPDAPILLVNSKANGPANIPSKSKRKIPSTPCNHPSITSIRMLHILPRPCVISEPLLKASDIPAIQRISVSVVSPFENQRSPSGRAVDRREPAPKQTNWKNKNRTRTETRNRERRRTRLLSLAAE